MTNLPKIPNLNNVKVTFKTNKNLMKWVNKL